MGISVKDSEFIDIDTYFEMVEIEIKMLKGESGERKATQADIDRFLL
ncbi:MAG: hypothetical protein FWE36_00160 [Erysipelotrichales bacterium]|nr:hypothetical protein [Erysipelotrichales bacterium]